MHGKETWNKRGYHIFCGVFSEHAARIVKKQRWEKAALADDVEGNARRREICTGNIISVIGEL